MFLFDVLRFYKVFEPDIMLYFAVELLALVLELFLFCFSLFFESLEIFLGLIAGIIGVIGKLDSVLNVLVFLIKFCLQFIVNGFHSIFLFSKLTNLLPQFVVVRLQLIEFLV